MLKSSGCHCRLFSFAAATLIFAGLLGPPASVNSEADRTFESFIQTFATGRIDWNNGIIYGTGRAFLDQNAQSRPMAMRAAKLIAASNILKLAAGVNLDDRHKVGQLEGGNFVIRLKALLRFAEHDARLVDNTDRPYYEVTRKTTLAGIKGLNVQILEQVNTSAPEGLQFPQNWAEPIRESDEDPWLVLDARGLENHAAVQPALFPKIILPTGEAIYNLDAINPAALEIRSMIRYVESADDLKHLQGLNASSDSLAMLIDRLFHPSAAQAEDDGLTRKKRRRFIVQKAKGLQGLTRTNLVISQTDARALQQEDAASRILKNCRVIVIVSSPVGGVEGSRPSRAANG